MTGPAMASYRLRVMVWGGALLLLSAALVCTPASAFPGRQARASTRKPAAAAKSAGTTEAAAQAPAPTGDTNGPPPEAPLTAAERGTANPASPQQVTGSSACDGVTPDIGEHMQTCYDQVNDLLQAAQRLPKPSPDDGADTKRQWGLLQRAAKDWSAGQASDQPSTTGSALETLHATSVLSLVPTLLMLPSCLLLLWLFLKTQQAQKANAEVHVLLGSIRKREEEAGNARKRYEELRAKYEILSSERRISQLAEDTMGDDSVQETYPPLREEISREPHSIAPASAGRVNPYASSADSAEDASLVQSYAVADEATPAKYAPILMQEPAPAAAYQSSGDPVADYNHARSLGSADGGDWFRGKHASISLSCRNLGELKLNPAARLFFERAGRGDFLALDHRGLMLVFPAFSVDLASSRAFLDGVFRYTDGGTPRVTRAATVEASREEWVLQQPGEITGG